MQNHGLGAYTIVAFCAGYKSVSNKILNLFMQYL